MILILASIISVIGSDICNNLNNDQITCDALKPLCYWENQCKSGMKIEQPNQIKIFDYEYSSYCNNLSICSQTYGCANYSKQCTIFLGCDAYIGKSEFECYQISYLCNWSEQKGCYRSSDYDYNGKLNVTRNCSNAPQWLISKEGCQNYSQYCYFNGFQCLDQQYNCSQYSNTIDCTKLIGIDGQCKYGTNNKCESQVNQIIKYCDINSNNCIGTIDNCYFNGKKCQKTPLQNCELYNINECEGKIGNNGYCTLKDNQCQVLSCKEYQKFINTSNIENSTLFCQEIKNICIDDQCAYLNQDECIQNNNCTQIKNHCIHKEKGCQFYSKEQCPEFCNNINTKAIIQKSTCIDALSSYECSQIEQLYTNIPCYWSNIEQQCKFVQRCDQMQYVNNDTDCQRLKNDCYFEENQCLDSKQQFCSSFKKLKYCNYENGCIWTNKCISLLFDCTNYLFEDQCYMDIYKRPCVWKKKQCYRYQEHQNLDSKECNIISNKWQFINGTCQVKPKCSHPQDEYGFEGNCNEYFTNLYELSKKSCNDYKDQQEQCNKSRFKCVYINNKCEQLTSCNQIRQANLTSIYCNTNYTECSQIDYDNCTSIKGINQKEFRYCRKIAGKCMQVLPINEIDCYLYGQYDGKLRKFKGNYCQLVDDENICYARMIQIPQDFSSSNIIMIYILIQFLIQ